MVDRIRAKFAENKAAVVAAAGDGSTTTDERAEEDEGLSPIDQTAEDEMV